MEHKGMGRRDLVCQQDRFPIVAVWRFFCRRENWGNRGNDAACCANPHHTKSIEVECKDEDANYPLSRSLCVESNLITLPLQRKKFSVFYQRRKSIRPPALFPSTLLPFPLPLPLFLSFSRAAPLRSCCTSNSSNYCYGSDEKRERERERAPTDSVGYSLPA